MRTSNRDLQSAAIRLARMVLAAHVGSVDDANGAALRVTTQGRESQAVHVIGRALASGNDGVRTDNGPDGAIVLVVGDRVPEPARRALRALGAGWIDRRGHLFIPGLTDDDGISIKAQPRHPTAASGDNGSEDPFGRGRATREVAATLLIRPTEPLAVRALARQVELSPAAISWAADRLTRGLLIHPDGRPLLPQLFWSLAPRWQPRWVALDGDPRDSPASDLLCVAADTAAIEHGAPMLTGRHGGRFYVAGDADLQAVVEHVGVDPDPLAPRYAVAVTPAIAALAGGDGRIVPPVIAALDLAHDPARGQEVLQSWARRWPDAPWAQR